MIATLRNRALGLAIAIVCLACTPGHTQEARLRIVEKVELPTETDGNSPSFWLDGRMHLFTSVGRPLKISKWDSQLRSWESDRVDVTTLVDQAIWVEAAWVDDDGTVFGWYHHEPAGLHDEWYLTAPKIGAVVSFDGGNTVHDLGFLLESGDPLDPDSKNGAFLGGHGDFSVVLDREREYFYFFFTNYGGEAETQGIAVARMAFADRFEPVGKVHKYHQGLWNEPGLGGRMTAIFPAERAWQKADPDSFWGPAVHWNTYLNCFVVLLNRASGEPGWSQEGLYVSYAVDLSQPTTWKPPVKLLESTDFPSWGTFYPQVIGLDAGDTDTVAGATAKFFVSGKSQWEIDFYTPEDLLRVNPIPGTRPSPNLPGLKP